MEIKYNNIYIHYVMITQNRQRVILEKNRNRIEKYITGIISNNSSKLYSIYANPEHVHFLVSKSPKISEERLLTIVADSSKAFINDNNLTPGFQMRFLAIQRNKYIAKNLFYINP